MKKPDFRALLGAPTARERIAAGQPATEVCFACGFRDYSTFARAYRKLFSEPPRAVRSEFS